MDHDDVQRWLDGYVAAWSTYDPGEIGALFGEKVSYRDYPYDDPIETRDQVVANWLEDRDRPGSYEGSYEVVAVDGDTAVARGTSKYLDESGGIASLYYNVFIMRFDDRMRCVEWTEYFSRDPRFGE